MDCRKISGGAYSTNVVFPDSSFKLISGQPKTIEKKADSGKSITSFFCGDCGTTLYRQGEAFKDMTIIKYGVMDDPKSMEDAKPGAELYAPERPSWIPQTSGTQEMKAMS